MDVSGTIGAILNQKGSEIYSIAPDALVFEAIEMMAAGAGTYDLVRDHVVVRQMGSPELKGKSVAVEVYELIGLREDTEVQSEVRPVK